MRYLDISVRLTKTEKLTITIAGKGVEQFKFSHVVGGNVKGYKNVGKQFSGFFKS